MKLDQWLTGKSQITYKILAYLTKHPDAQDTLEGIVEWWLLEQKIERETEKVKEALAELIGKGLILERRDGDSRSFYKINLGKYGEIQALLKEGFE